MIDDRTPLLNLPLPNAANTLLEDVARLRTALSSLDTAVNGKATSADITAAINAVLAGAPAALDTLSELSAALGNDADFAGTITTALAGKAPLTGATFTGTVTAPSFAGNLNWSYIQSAPTTIAGYGITDAPTKTGTGASGSWGISVTGSSASCTGNAATATTATTANALNASNSYTVAGFVTDQMTVGNGNSSATINMKDSDNGDRSIHNNSNQIGFLTQAGGWGAWCDDAGNWTAALNVIAYSDERIKCNWRDLPGDFLSKLAGVKTGVYDRTDIEATQVGVSAQSLQAVMPEAVTEGADGLLAVAYGNAALTACVMLAREVEGLKAKILALEGAK
jgi:Chaperone of endosialidase